MSSPADQTIHNIRRQTLEQELSQCQGCYKHVPPSDLKVCGRCKWSRYCSRECQKKAYPGPKSLCKVNAAAALKPVQPNVPSAQDQKSFLNVHRPAVSRVVETALALRTEEGRRTMKNKFLTIAVTWHPDATEDGKKFSFLAAWIDSNDEIERMFPQLDLFGTKNRLGADALTNQGADLFTLVLWRPFPVGGLLENAPSSIFVSPFFWFEEDLKRSSRLPNPNDPDWMGTLRRQFEGGVPAQGDRR